MRLFFARLDEKHNLFEIFQKIFIRKLIKMHYFCIFLKDLTSHALIFCAFGRKTHIFGKFWENFENFWWKCYRKIEIFSFNFIFRKFVTKNRAFGYNTIFLQQFFRFGGGDFPLPPGYALGISDMGTVPPEL